MRLADEVQALELERDALKVQLAAAQAAVAAMTERGATTGDFWRARAERAEARVATYEAYKKVQAYAGQTLPTLGEWNLWFNYDGNDGAGLNFEDGTMAMALSGLLQGWFKNPRPMEIRISEPAREEASVDGR